MAGRKKRTSSKSDSAEAAKPLIVLVLLGMILYGGYSVIQKGRDRQPEDGVAERTDAPPFDPEIAASGSRTPPPDTDQFSRSPDLPTVEVSLPQPESSAGPTYVAGREGLPPTSGGLDPTPPTAIEMAPAGGNSQPGLADVLPPAAFPGTDADERQIPSEMRFSRADKSRSQLAAFTADWDEAHDQLSAGRYAEASDLAVEERQRLEDLLSQLAGTVIYSQQDLLMPPHIVAAGETLPAIAAPLGVNWQLLAKINGIPSPDGLLPGEPLKLLRGPFDAEVSLSRRRLTLRLTGNYAGSFPVAVGEAVAARADETLAVVQIQRGALETNGAVQQASFELPQSSQAAEQAIRLEGDLMILAADDPAEMADEPPATHLIISGAHLADLLDILTPASRITVGR
jgi:LysM repeat protein